jgi:hypothetical protein
MNHKKNIALRHGMDVARNVSEAKKSTATNAVENFCGYLFAFFIHLINTRAHTRFASLRFAKRSFCA